MKSLCRIRILAPSVSHPARGAWIEIMVHPTAIITPEVAPRKGCVD